MSVLEWNLQPEVRVDEESEVRVDILCRIFLLSVFDRVHILTVSLIGVRTKQGPFYEPWTKASLYHIVDVSYSRPYCRCTILH